MSAPVPAHKHRNTFADVRHGTSTFDFTHRLWRWVAVSGTLLLVSVLALGLKGLNFGIDFTGGVSWQVAVATGKSVSTAGARELVAENGANDPTVQILTSNNGTKAIRVEANKVPNADRIKIRDALAEYAGAKPTDVSLSEVSASWGRQISEQALKALVVFLLCVMLYLTIRLEWKMALASNLAVIHDIIITVGIYALFGFPVTPATVVAFLTILGYSLYDTVVVFDKVKENQATLGHIRGETYSDMVNRSTNHVLMRSLNTSFVALLPVLSLLFVGSFLLGATALVDFALALGIGLAVGAYSSIFVATPLFAWMKEKEPRSRSIRERALAARAADAASGTGTAEPVDAGGHVDAAAAEDDDARPAPARTAAGTLIQPRPRKKTPKKR